MAAVAPQISRPSIGNDVEMPRPPLPFAAAALVIGGIEHMRERHMEHLRHLALVRRQHQARRNDADNRRDRKAGAGFIGAERAQHIDMAAIERHFLLGLAQRGRHRAIILRVDAAARKGNLPGVLGQLSRPARQQQLRLGLVRHGDQHRGRHQQAAGLGRRIVGHLPITAQAGGGRAREDGAQARQGHQARLMRA